MTDVEKVTYYNPHAGVTGRDGGPYGDQVERAEAEVNRAAKEGRAPNFETATASVGVPLVVEAVLQAQGPNLNSNPSMILQPGSTNDGLETLPLDVRTEADANDKGEFAALTDAKGEPVKNGEVANGFEKPDANLNSPLVPVPAPSGKSSSLVGGSS